MTKKEEFRNALINLKNKKMLNGFDPNAIYVQACLETGHFKETDNLVQHYNFFGIKAHKGYEGLTVKRVPTTEIEKGKEVKITDDFMAFADSYKGLVFYQNKIIHQYPNAFNGRRDYKEFYKGLMNGVYKWSTSTGIDEQGNKTKESYDEALIRIYERMKGEGEFV